MKYETDRLVSSSGVQDTRIVEFSLGPGEAQRLRDALEVVQTCQSAAARVAKANVHGRNSDCEWAMFEYSVKNDRVIVTVRRGSIG